MRLVPITAICALICGCGGGQLAATDSPPSDYRETILRNKSTLFKDPESVRDAMISPPTKALWGYRVCLKANAKNSFGGYTGQTMVSVLLYSNGRPPLAQQPTIYDGCDSEHFEPFHELEGNYVPPGGPPGPKSGKPRST